MILTLKDTVHKYKQRSNEMKIFRKYQMTWHGFIFHYICINWQKLIFNLTLLSRGFRGGSDTLYNLCLVYVINLKFGMEAALGIRNKIKKNKNTKNHAQ